MFEILLYLKDYANEGHDRYFLAAKGKIEEVNAHEVVSKKELLVCHDYWLIAPSIQQQAGSLPVNVVDVEEFRIS
ncbi:DNA polymerase I, partial [Pseudomonas sp. MOB-449]|nr:DNA polymerase I [Pseudomonas sp. MOB-449]